MRLCAVFTWAGTSPIFGSLALPSWLYKTSYDFLMFHSNLSPAHALDNKLSDWSCSLLGHVMCFFLRVEGDLNFCISRLGEDCGNGNLSENGTHSKKKKIIFIMVEEEDERNFHF